MESTALSRSAIALFVTLASSQVASAQVAKPPVIQKPAYSGNYSHYTSAKHGVVIHKEEGDTAEIWFQNPAAQASTQYAIHHDGTIYQCVPDAMVAWHSGNHAYNLAFLSIEHAGYTARNDVAEAEYRASARLVAWMAVTYRFPIDRTHIIGHSEVPDPFHPGQFGGAGHHTDPGPYWAWAHYIDLVRQFANGHAPAGGYTPPPSGGGSSGDPILRQGSQGAAVATLQRLLASKGFSPGAADGVFGPKTAAQVRAFQASRHLAADGVVGPQTWAALRASTSTSGGGAPAPSSHPVLKQGDRGAAVVTLQRDLAAKGFSPGAADGDFGPHTAAAVRAFQASRHLAVDGVVGPLTWAALLR